MNSISPQGLHSHGRSARKSSGSFDLGRLLSLLLGLVILVLALPPFFKFPWLGFWLVPLAAMYFCLLFIMPRLWLIVLPMATVGLDITPWTGRFSYNELDLLFLITISSGLILGRFRFKVFAPSPAVLILLIYIMVTALRFTGWGSLVIPPGEGLSNPYYETDYSYKVVKGMLWGILLVPMWGSLLATDKRRTVYALVGGVSAAAILLGLIILWERGTLGILLSGSAWYHVANSFLDLSSSYRVTGIISDMHTGGEAIDGVLLLFLPITFYGCIYGKVNWLRVLAAIGFLSLAYVALVGFTRTTYAAFVLGLVCISCLIWFYRQKSNLGLPFRVNLFLALLAVGSITATAAFKLAGSFGLLIYVILLLLAFATSKWPASQIVAKGSIVLAAIAVGAAGIAHFSSRWVESSILGFLLLALCLGASYWVALKLFSEQSLTSRINQVFVLGALVLLPVIAAFALGGYQIKDRTTRVMDDLDTRQGHWGNVIASSDSGPLAWLIGNGVGSFPARYIGTFPERVKDVGSFNIRKERQRNLLTMGSGLDLTIGQRTSIQPFTDYHVSVELRSEAVGNIVFALCERNLIYASNFMPNCTRKRLNYVPTEGALEEFTLELNSGKVGSQRGIMRWPTLMTIQHDNNEAVVDIATVKLSLEGLNQLQNSSFKEGLDYWFYYNDFAHLPWHIKNLFLQVWFENGWLGVGLFLALLGLLVRSNLERRAHDSLNPVYTSAVLILCFFGFFGSPLDSARVSWMFYFLLCAGLVQLRVVKPEKESKFAISGSQKRA
ncbi:MAG: hypothetical protein ACI9J0_003390 [Cryomorphaceae bacterium]|jgi:hypothetical protein